MLPNAKAKLLRQLQSRQGRRKSDVFLCEGLRCCQEAVQRQPEGIDFAVLASGVAPPWAETPRWPVYEVSEREFGELAQTESPQGMLLVLQRPSTGPLETSPDPFILVLDRIQIPGNLGTMLRTALAVGLQQVACTRGTVDPWSAKAIRAGMGAQFGLHIALFEDLETLRAYFAKRGYHRSWLTVLSGGADCFTPAFDLRDSLLILGNEANGVGNLPGADQVSIPMAPGVESLNVAQAATLLMYQQVARFGMPGDA